MGLIANRFPERWIIFSTTGILALSLAVWSFTPNIPLLLIISLPLALASGILNTILRSSLTKSVDSEEVGGILGLSASLESATRVIAPSLGGFLLGALGTWVPGVVGALIMVGVLIYVWIKVIPESGD